MNINTILSQIDLGSYAMPVFQRGYVWNRDQVRKLMNSLYRGYPIGELLVWNTATDPSISKGDGPLTPGNVNLILDGQQRMTSLYGIIRGYPPKFFDGNEMSFTNLYFNVRDEIFEFYMAAKMKNDPSWISVTELMLDGAAMFVQKKMQEDPDNRLFWLDHMSSLVRLEGIKNIQIHVETVSGPDKTIDIVVDIFNNVNSGGTKLSKGDLALAKICGEWSSARDELKKILSRLHRAGYDFSIEWLLRCITVWLTGQPYFNVIGQLPIEDIKKGIPQTEGLIGTCLDYIGTRLGLDHTRVLGSPYAIATMIGYIRFSGGKLSSVKEWDKLLYWYVHAFLWGRYAGSTESALAQDLNTISRGDGIDGLIKLLKQSRGDLTIRPEDFWGWSTGARFYPLLYIGSTSRMPRKAWYSGNRYHTHAAFHQAIVENGGDDAFRTAFKHYYLTKDSTWAEYEGSEPFPVTNLFDKNEAERIKRRYIREYNATDPQYGLNAATGGRIDFSYAYGAKQRQSDTRTGKDGRTDWRVYIHENKINHKRYVGVTCRDPKSRWANGKGYRRPSEQTTKYSHFDNAIEKYGWDGFEHIIVAEGLTKFQAAEMEKALIAKYDTTNPERGYNVTRGGDGTSGACHTEETKQTLSVIAKKRVEKTGIVNFKGQHHSEDTKAKLRDLMSGRYDGNKNPFAGKHHTEETRQKLSDKQSQPVNQYDMQGRFIRQYGSASEASAAIGVSVTSISYATTGKTRFAGNYLWKKTSEEFPAGVDVDPTAILGNSKHTGQKKRVRQFTKEGTLIKEYASLKDAAEAVGANVANISAAAYGRTKTCRGFIWMFSD